MVFPETSKVSLFKLKTKQISDLIEQSTLLTRLTLCVFDTGDGLNLIRADLSDPVWMDSFRQLDVLAISSASDIKLKLSGTVTTHVRMGEPRTLVNLAVVSELFMLFLLSATYIERLLILIHLAERKTELHYFPPVPMLMEYEAKCEAELV